MNKICVVIPMYGKHEYTKMCVSMCKTLAGIPVDILVVDDGSKIPFEFDGVEVLRLEQNTGFTNAANQGILVAQKREYEYVHLLNNDTEHDADFIKHLLDVMEDKSVAIASSIRIHRNNPENMRVELFGTDLIRGHQQMCADGKVVEPISCNWVPLCSSLIRMDVIREIGLLDKRMRMYSSDNDYCFRAKIAGYKVIVVPKSRVHHVRGGTTNNSIDPSLDQRVLIEKMAGIHYASLMKEMPLDSESNTYGCIEFSVYQK